MHSHFEHASGDNKNLGLHVEKWICQIGLLKRGKYLVLRQSPTGVRDAQTCVCGTHADPRCRASPMSVPGRPERSLCEDEDNARWWVISAGTGVVNAPRCWHAALCVSGDARQINLPPVTVLPHKIQFLSRVQTDRVHSSPNPSSDSLLVSPRCACLLVWRF